MKKNKWLLYSFFLLLPFRIFCQEKKGVENFSVIGYYAGDAEHVKNYPVDYLTHIIYSFCHLKEGLLHVDNQQDSNTIRTIIALKKRNPALKVLLSLGGWGGCAPCSPVFSTAGGRQKFAISTKNLLEYFGADGIDLDWEYPAISGYPGHPFMPADKHNFTLLIQTLRKTLGKNAEISFAAGGLSNFLDSSVEWESVAPLVDKINLMTYDLVNGFSTVTGHHTPLYSTPQQQASTDFAIHYLDSVGVPRNKLVIGAAFYARVFDVYKNLQLGLYQPGKFDHGISYKNLDTTVLKDQGFVYYWDTVAAAPYMYSVAKKQMISFDDAHSIYLKTKYAQDKQLNGIMFWQLADDKTRDGLLSVIHKALTE